MVCTLILVRLQPGLLSELVPAGHAVAQIVILIVAPVLAERVGRGNSHDDAQRQRKGACKLCIQMPTNCVACLCVVCVWGVWGLAIVSSVRGVTIFQDPINPG